MPTLIVAAPNVQLLHLGRHIAPAPSVRFPKSRQLIPVWTVVQGPKRQWQTTVVDGRTLLKTSLPKLFLHDINFLLILNLT